MIKQISLIYKKPGLSNEEFYKCWKEMAGSLMVRLAPAGVRRYVQNHVVRMPGGKYEGDGFAEIWFDDLEAYKRFRDWHQTSEGKEISTAQEKFLDRSRTVRYVVEEHIIM